MSNKVTYLSEIQEVLRSLDGFATLKELNSKIEERDLLPAIHTNANWQRNVSAELQRHCSQTESYRGGEDIFCSVEGIGRGCWGLKEMINADNGVFGNPFFENPVEKRQLRKIIADNTLSVTEREAIVKARVGQGVFREQLITKYKKCIVTGIEYPGILIASHIKPWIDGNNYERISVDNGLLLSPLYDKLFDRGFMTFNAKMQILLSSKLCGDIRRISYDSARCYIFNPSQELKCNMEYHRDCIFRP